MALYKARAPALPTPPVDYDFRQQDQFQYALRLYFNRIDDALSQLSSNTGGAYLKFPNGAFHQDGYTTLSTTIPNGTSTSDIVVASTTGFLSAGALLIGNELISYTGKTATTFTGITRSQYSSSGSSHTAGVYVSEAQPVPSATTALAIAFTTTDTSNEVDISSTDQTKIEFAVSGYYNVQFSAQLLSFDNDIDDVCLWFRKNGTDVPFSAGYASIPSIHGGVAGAAIISWNLVIDVNAGDYIQLMLSTTTGNTVCATYPPNTAPVRPASPSIILTATFVSALY